MFVTQSDRMRARMHSIEGYTQRKSMREFSRIGKRVWRDIASLLAKNSRRNLRCSTPMPNSPPLALFLTLPSPLPFSSFLPLFCIFLQSSYLLPYFYPCIVFLSFLHTLEFYSSSLCSIYFSFSITIIMFLLSCAILSPPELSRFLSHAYTHAHILPCPIAPLVQRPTGRSVSYQLAFVLDVYELRNNSGIFISRWDLEETYPTKVRTWILIILKNC